MHAHTLFAGIGFEELKTMGEDTGDENELMKEAIHVFIDPVNKTAEADSSPVGLAMFDVSTRDNFIDENSIVPPSSRLEKLKKIKA